MIVKNEEGEDIEVFTQAELDEKLKGFVASDEVEALKAQLVKMEEASKNNAILRKKAEEAEKNKSGVETEFNSFKEEANKKFGELSAKLSEKEIGEYIASLSTDPDVVAKIKFNLGRISGEDTKQNVIDAYKMSVDNATIPTSFISSAGAGAGVETATISSDVKDLAAKMGVTEADFKKANIK